MTQIEEEKVLIDAIVSALTPMLYTKQRGLMKQVEFIGVWWEVWLSLLDIR